MKIDQKEVLYTAILTYRQGRLLGKNCHVLSVFGQREEQIVDLVMQYYQNHELPKEIVARVEGLKEGFNPNWNENIDSDEEYEIAADKFDEILDDEMFDEM